MDQDLSDNDSDEVAKLNARVERIDARLDQFRQDWETKIEPNFRPLAAHINQVRGTPLPEIVKSRKVVLAALKAGGEKGLSAAGKEVPWFLSQIALLDQQGIDWKSDPDSTASTSTAT